MVNPLLNSLYCLFSLLACLGLGYGTYYFVDIIPASLYGMAYMAIALKLNIINPARIQSSIEWIIKNMGVCFVPAGVGIMLYLDLISQYGVILLVFTVISSLLLLLIVGSLFQKLSTPPVNENKVLKTEGASVDD